ncbi:DUF6215 domain-containing protein [Streptomyces sp. NPDC020983]|uniref:DUF6215 domain-containing protein n=1 Tax=Streptomyces sp. NPDC020983 TaxID=3365106 RepID=UPI0037A7AF35
MSGGNENQAQPKGPGAVGQVVTAVALIGALGAALLFYQHTHADEGPADDGRGTTCSHDGHAKPAADSPYLSGEQLCDLLFRPDLAGLLGTPGEKAKSTTTSGSTPPTDGKGLSGPYAQVSFPTYTVNLAASYGNFTVSAGLSIFGADAQRRSVLGHPALAYADRTMEIRFKPGSGSSSSGHGAPARVLSVSMSPKDTGTSFDISLWRTDGAFPPDDATLLHVAEALLPGLPGWTTA